MRIPSVSWLAIFIDGLRNSLAALVGLFALIALAILVVWPLWYVATMHTRIYSLAIVLLAGGCGAVLIWARVRRVPKKNVSPGIKPFDGGIQLPGPEENRQ